MMTRSRPPVGEPSTLTCHMPNRVATPHTLPTDPSTIPAHLVKTSSKLARMNAAPLDITGNHLDPIWAAEFRGYFFGDGYLGIVRNGTGRGAHSTARAQITTRDDDVEMLYDISSKLGGKVTLAGNKNRICNPVAIWRTRNMKDVERVCDILEDGLMPSKKRAEIIVVRKYLSIHIPRGPRVSYLNYDALYAEKEACIVEIQRLHSYQTHRFS